MEVIDDDIMGDAPVRIRRRRLADVKKPFESLSEEEFTKRYRFTKNGVMEIFSSIKHDITLANRTHSLNPLLQLTIALRFYAAGHFQLTDGDLLGVSRMTAGRSVHKISQAIARNKVCFIAPIHDVPRLKAGFFSIKNFPGVVGAIDCTHIPIASPGGDSAELFRNRKGYMSLNVQAVCDADRKIMNIVVRWPGSTHDSRIFENSRLRDKFEDGEIDGVLLGDGGYPCRKYLLTPLTHPTTTKEKRYNIAHITTRARIEQCFGVLKQRFRALRIPLRTSVDNSVESMSTTPKLQSINQSISRQSRFAGDSFAVAMDASQSGVTNSSTDRQSSMAGHFSAIHHGLLTRKANLSHP